MAAVAAPGTTIFAAMPREPEIVDLQGFPHGQGLAVWVRGDLHGGGIEGGRPCTAGNIPSGTGSWPVLISGGGCGRAGGEVRVTGVDPRHTPHRDIGPGGRLAAEWSASGMPPA